MATFKLRNWKPQYLKGENPETTRLIGVEFEGEPKSVSEIENEYEQIITDAKLDESITWDYARRAYVATKDGKKYKDRFDFMKKYLAKNLGIEVGGIGVDGGGREFATLPDSYGNYVKGGSERFKKVVAFLERTTNADRDSGTHINISKLDSDTRTTWNNIYWYMMCFGPQLQKIFGRRSHWAKIPLPKEYFCSNSGSNMMFEVPTKRPKPEWVYSKGSMVVDKGNRYEFRGPKASHDLDEVLAWIQFCNNIVEICANGYIKDMPFAEALKGKYIRAYLTKIAENPEREITSKERAMTISKIGYVKVINEQNKIF